MKIHHKLIIILSLAWLVILGVIGILSISVILDDYNKLDQQQMHKNLERAELSIRQYNDGMYKLTLDWARWDSTYDFIKSPNEAYVKDTINPPTYIDSNLNFIIYYNTERKLVFGAVYNEKTEKLTHTIPKNLLDYIKSSKKILYHAKLDDSLYGMFNLGGRMIALSSAPITTSRLTGPSRGTLIMARYFSSAEIKAVSDVLKLPIIFTPFATVDKKLQSILTNEKYYITKTSEDIAGYILLKDINGNPLAVISIQQPRAIYIQGKKSIVYYLIALVGIGILIALIVWLCLRFMVLNRILSIRDQLKNITKEQNFAMETRIRGDDEVSDISGDINGLLEVIIGHENELNKRLENLEEINDLLHSEIDTRLSIEKQLKLKQQQLDYMAHHDALTGLPNRTLLNEKLLLSLEEAQRKGKKIAVLFLDLDGFKDLNDTQGHKVGDIYLKHLAKSFSNVVGKNDVIARLGGDEFLIYTVQNDSVFNPEFLAEELIKEVALTQVDEADTIKLTASIGVSIYPNHADNISDLLRTADLAMYRAKHTGKNRLVVYDANIEEASIGRIKMEADMRKAIENKEFESFFQPIYDVNTLKPSYIEALVHWNQPGNGKVFPNSFITFAEHSGLIYDITQQVILECCSALKRWHELNISFDKCCINISTRCFDNNNFSNDLINTLAKYGVNNDNIMLEITETSIIENIVLVADKLQKLKDNRFAIAIDDFGTGYSSLLTLKYLPVTCLKIDRRFIHMLGKDKESEVFVKSIIGLAHGLNMRVVAEGVETEEQFNWLKGLECDYAQGFYFSRPISFKELTELMRQKAP